MVNKQLAPSFNLIRRTHNSCNLGPTKTDVFGEAVFLSSSCGDISRGPAPHASHESKVAVAQRGGCSFGTKALTAQHLGFSSLLLVDKVSATSGPNSSPPPPPGLGEESSAVHIPVVMVSAAAWLLVSPHWGQGEFDAHFSDNRREGLTSGPNLRLQLLTPSEADLWSASPWYSKSRGMLSFVPVDASHYAPLCQDRDLGLVSDDPWLYQKWLDQLSTGRCKELSTIRPRLTLESETSIGVREMAELQNSMDKDSSSVGLLRLPALDATGESMGDIGLLNPEENGRSSPASPFSATPSAMGPSAEAVLNALRGLKSASHSFSWGGRNTYPRYFQG